VRYIYLDSFLTKEKKMMRKFLKDHHPLPSSNRPKPAYNSGQKFKKEPGKINNKKKECAAEFYNY